MPAQSEWTVRATWLLRHQIPVKWILEEWRGSYPGSVTWSPANCARPKRLRILNFTPVMSTSSRTQLEKRGLFLSRRS